MATTSHLFLGAFSIKGQSAVTSAVVGSFYESKHAYRKKMGLMAHNQQLIVATGSVLTIYEQELTGMLRETLRHDTFAVIRQLDSFRIPGTTTDSLVVASDSGRLAILGYDPEAGDLERVKLETYGHSGARRSVPGQYLACDLRGRGCIVASVEKNRILYILNRDAETRELSISSPIESLRRGALTYSVISLDDGWNNPIFASLELDIGDGDTEMAKTDRAKHLTFYTLDLSLNTVIQKPGFAVDNTANMLLMVPAMESGPGGVIVCALDNVTYYRLTGEAYRVRIPRRGGAAEDPNRQRCIVASHCVRTRHGFFYLIQSNDGDIFKFDVDWVSQNSTDSKGQTVMDHDVHGVRISYFDTMPVATHILSFRSGYLVFFMATGDHRLCLVEDLGGDTDASQAGFDPETQRPPDPMYFHPHELEHFSLKQTMPNLAGMVDAKVTDLSGDDSHEICAVTGAGGNSAFRVMRNAHPVVQMEDMDLPISPQTLFTLKIDPAGEEHDFLVMSDKETTVMNHLDSEMAQVETPGFVTDQATLAASHFGGVGFVQVYPYGVRQVIGTPGQDFQTHDWEVPSHTTINAADCNERQVVVGLSDGTLIYFEADQAGTLIEFGKHRKCENTITCLSIGPIPSGELRSPLMAVGFGSNETSVCSLDPNDEDECLEAVADGMLPARPVSVLITSMPNPQTGVDGLVLHTGLDDGSYLRVGLTSKGELSDSTRRFLGPDPVMLAPTIANGVTAVLAMSHKTFLSWSDTVSHDTVVKPLDYAPLSAVAELNFSTIRGAKIGVSNTALKIFSFENITRDLIETQIPLALTPRSMVQHPSKPLFYVIESDYNTLSNDEKERRLGDPNLVNGDAKALDPAMFGQPRVEGGWASCIQVVDPTESGSVLCTVHLDEGEAATSVTVAPFKSQDDELFLIVGTSLNMRFFPRSYDTGFIRVYQVFNEGRALEFVHSTDVKHPPTALTPYQGLVLAGIDKAVTMIDIGSKKILRKAQASVVQNVVTSLKVQGRRIAVGDRSESVTYVVHKPKTRELFRIADDAVPRWMTSLDFVDYDTVMGGDKFGNLFLLRCPEAVSIDADEEGSEVRLRSEREYLGGLGTKLEPKMHYYTGDLPMSIQKTRLVSGGEDVVVWTGLGGTIGVLIPIKLRSTFNQMQGIVDGILARTGTLLGRDHLSYRGYYDARKGMVDGDMMERYIQFAEHEKAGLANDVDESDYTNIERKIHDLRSRQAW